MAWKNSGIAKPIPSEIASLASSLGGVMSALGPLLSTVSSLLNLASGFYGGVQDPYSSLTTALIKETENAINNLFGTGLYNLIVDPVNRSGIIRYDSVGVPLLTPFEAINLAIKSLDDVGDLNRPIFSNSAEVVGLGFLITAPTLDQFLGLITQMRGILTVSEWELLFNLFDRIKTPADAAAPPDWKSIRLNSFTELKEMQDVLLDLLGTTKGYSVVPDSNVRDLIDIINVKLIQLQNLTKSLNSLASGLKHTTGIYVMNMPVGAGGNTRIKAYLKDCPLMRSTNQYTAIALFIGGGPSIYVVDTFRYMMA